MPEALCGGGPGEPMTAVMGGQGVVKVGGGHPGSDAGIGGAKTLPGSPPQAPVSRSSSTVPPSRTPLPVAAPIVPIVPEAPAEEPGIRRDLTGPLALLRRGSGLVAPNPAAAKVRAAGGH